MVDTAGNLPKNRRVGLISLGMALGMLGLSFAAVPLYRLFCQKTGYGGTPARASEAQAATVKAVTGRDISIRFDSNVDTDMGWAFHPEKTTVTLPIGERRLAFFDAENLTGHAITGAASYNIAPDEAASYFTKVQCFCFTRQTLKPHEKVRMPVLFYVNPKIMDDPEARDVQQITLSYTFHTAPSEASR